MNIVLVSAAALVDQDGRVLLSQRPEGKELEGFLPSGQIEINGVTVGPSVVNGLLQQLSNQEYQIQSVIVE